MSISCHTTLFTRPQIFWHFCRICKCINKWQQVLQNISIRWNIKYLSGRANQNFKMVRLKVQSPSQIQFTKTFWQNNQWSVFERLCLVYITCLLYSMTGIISKYFDNILKLARVHSATLHRGKKKSSNVLATFFCVAQSWHARVKVWS
jgi:hypothetical protein